MRRLLAALVVVAAAGCGGDDEPAAGPASTPTPTATATATPTPTVTATPTPTPTATPESPEDQPGGAGDEEAARVPVELTVGPDGITPPEVSVPAFLALEVVVRNARPEQVLVRLEGAEPMTIGPGATFRANLEGRRPGRYAIDAGEAGQAVLVTGVEPGP